MIVSIGNIQSMDKVTPWYFLILMVLYALSLTGAIRMWKLHRDGNFLYVAAQLLILFLPVVQLGWGGILDMHFILQMPYLQWFLFWGILSIINFSNASLNEFSGKYPKLENLYMEQTIISDLFSYVVLEPESPMQRQKLFLQ